MRACFSNNGAVDFVDLHFDQLNPDGSNLASVMTQDATDFNCRLTPLPAVSL